METIKKIEGLLGFSASSIHDQAKYLGKKNDTTIRELSIQKAASDEEIAKRINAVNL